MFFSKKNLLKLFRVGALVNKSTIRKAKASCPEFCCLWLADLNFSFGAFKSDKTVISNFVELHHKRCRIYFFIWRGVPTRITAKHTSLRFQTMQLIFQNGVPHLDKTHMAVNLQVVSLVLKQFWLNLKSSPVSIFSFGMSNL